MNFAEYASSLQDIRPLIDIFDETIIELVDPPHHDDSRGRLIKDKRSFQSPNSDWNVHPIAVEIEGEQEQWLIVCPYCGTVHRHGAVEGGRSPHCGTENMIRSGYTTKDNMHYILRIDPNHVEYQQLKKLGMQRISGCDVIAARAMTLEELNLSVRSYNCLSRANIKEVGELATVTLQQLEGIRNLGQKGIDEITTAMQNAGFTNWPIDDPDSKPDLSKFHGRWKYERPERTEGGTTKWPT